VEGTFRATFKWWSQIWSTTQSSRLRWRWSWKKKLLNRDENENSKKYLKKHGNHFEFNWSIRAAETMAKRWILYKHQSHPTPVLTVLYLIYVKLHNSRQHDTDRLPNLIRWSSTFRIFTVKTIKPNQPRSLDQRIFEKYYLSTPFPHPTVCQALVLLEFPP
jgi:hypothetical protein